MNPSPEYRYVLWRIAAAQGCRPWELVGAAAGGAREQAQRESGLILKTLSLPEAARVLEDEVVIEAVVERMRVAYAEAGGFDADLAKAGLDGTLLRRAIGSELRAGLVLEQATAVAVSDGEVRDYYASHRERMVRPETRSARHILITINDDYADNRREAARGRIDALLEGPIDPERFALLAQHHSECPTALEGGCMGQVRRGQLYPMLEQVLFGLATGEVSGVVESPLGFHLLLCESIEPARTLALGEAEAGIRRLLEKKARKQRLAAFLAGGALLAR